MIQDLINQLTEKLVAQAQLPENKEKIQRHILDPIISYIVNAIMPYVIITYSIIILILILLIVLVIMQLRKS
jgi:hypothetical protein